MVNSTLYVLYLGDSLSIAYSYCPGQHMNTLVAGLELCRKCNHGAPEIDDVTQECVSCRYMFNCTTLPSKALLSYSGLLTLVLTAVEQLVGTLSEVMTRYWNVISWCSDYC